MSYVKSFFATVAFVAVACVIAASLLRFPTIAAPIFLVLVFVFAWAVIHKDMT